jgi:hypothetical protein
MYSERFELERFAGAALFGAVTLVAFVWCEGDARADEPTAATTSAATAVNPLARLEEAARLDSWSSARERPFLSSVIETGLPFARTQLALGYGRPHDTWLGLEGGSKISSSAVNMMGGVRGALPSAGFGLGLRYTASVARDFLPPRETYFRRDTELDVGENARYLALDFDVSLGLPVPFGQLALTGITSYLFALPEDVYVYEESARTIVAPPLVLRGRAAYELGIGEGDPVRVGPLAELIWSGGRDPVVRVGPTARVRLSPRLEAYGSVVFALRSPDELGLLGGDASQIGLRLRWATGTREPARSAASW